MNNNDYTQSLGCKILAVLILCRLVYRSVDNNFLRDKRKKQEIKRAAQRNSSLNSDKNGICKFGEVSDASMVTHEVYDILY